VFSKAVIALNNQQLTQSTCSLVIPDSFTHLSFLRRQESKTGQGYKHTDFAFYKSYRSEDYKGGN